MKNSFRKSFSITEVLNKIYKDEISLKKYISDLYNKLGIIKADKEEIFKLLSIINFKTSAPSIKIFVQHKYNKWKKELPKLLSNINLTPKELFERIHASYYIIFIFIYDRNMLNQIIIDKNIKLDNIESKQNHERNELLKRIWRIDNKKKLYEIFIRKADPHGGYKQTGSIFYKNRNKIELRRLVDLSR